MGKRESNRSEGIGYLSTQVLPKKGYIHLSKLLSRAKGEKHTAPLIEANNDGLEPTCKERVILPHRQRETPLRYFGVTAVLMRLYELLLLSCAALWLPIRYKLRERSWLVCAGGMPLEPPHIPTGIT
ncbi:hypothetical protein TRVL_08007 [Trypanosoma vivax]|uniref:Uncharacterized protein n=1 Tax=Trypanosoma vivax (strain Y486) TaxID=1055687 RepID=G0U9C6_TRYVY|nr:hypothetical protein TRVL_08007 [Trypanosoma vivax]CCC54211.1 hypothetical protein, unlikely [Trypanosoma vivax Y486]